MSTQRGDNQKNFISELKPIFCQKLTACRPNTCSREHSFPVFHLSWEREDTLIQNCCFKKIQAKSVYFLPRPGIYRTMWMIYLPGRGRKGTSLHYLYINLRLHNHKVGTFFTLSHKSFYLSLLLVGIFFFSSTCHIVTR